MSAALTERPPRVRLRRTRRLVLGLVVLALLAGALLASRFTADARLARWTAHCTSRSGAVTLEPATEPNPLLVQSPDRVRRCYGPTGRLLGTWR